MFPNPIKHAKKNNAEYTTKETAIEPIINGHLKQDYHLCRNYLKGINDDDNMNVILAAEAMNFKRVMNIWRAEAIKWWLYQSEIIFSPKFGSSFF